MLDIYWNLVLIVTCLKNICRWQNEQVILRYLHLFFFFSQGSPLTSTLQFSLLCIKSGISSKLSDFKMTKSIEALRLLNEPHRH